MRLEMFSLVFKLEKITGELEVSRMYAMYIDIRMITTYPLQAFKDNHGHFLNSLDKVKMK